MKQKQNFIPLTEAERHYKAIGESITEAQPGNMFGWKCLKYQKKPFLFFDRNSEQAMVFKLDAQSLAETLKLENTEEFNPANKGKPMKHWVVVPIQYQSLWEGLAIKAFENIINEIEYGKR